jgi:hypothetical protein
MHYDCKKFYSTKKLNEKHSSLLQYGMNYDCKKFYSTKCSVTNTLAYYSTGWIMTVKHLKVKRQALLLITVQKALHL